MEKEKIAIIGLLGVSLLAFGYLVHSKKSGAGKIMMKGPVAVAAVRGDAQSAEAPMVSGNAAVDYTRSLQDNVSTAERNTQKYEAAAAARMKAINETQAAGE